MRKLNLYVLIYLNFSSCRIFAFSCTTTNLQILQLISLVNGEHLPNQTRFLLVHRNVHHRTSVRLAVFDWLVLPLLSPPSSWVEAAVSPVWHVLGQILYGVKLDPPLLFPVTLQKYPLKIPVATAIFLFGKHTEPLEDGGGERNVGVGGSPARGPGVRVSNEEKVGDYRSELLPGLGGRQHGALQLHIPEASGNIHHRRGRRGRGGLLSALPREKRGVRGWGVPKKRGSTSAVATRVSGMFSGAGRTPWTGAFMCLLCCCCFVSPQWRCTCCVKLQQARDMLLVGSDVTQSLHLARAS